VKSIAIFVSSIIALSTLLMVLDRHLPERVGFGFAAPAWDANPQPEVGEEPGSGTARLDARPDRVAGRAGVPPNRSGVWNLWRMRSAGARVEVLRCVRGFDFFGASGSEDLLVRMRFGNHQPLFTDEQLDERRALEVAPPIAVARQTMLMTVEDASGATIQTSTWMLLLASDSSIVDIKSSEPDAGSNWPDPVIPEFARIGDVGEFPGGGWMLERGRSGSARLAVYMSVPAEGFLSTDGVAEFWLEIDLEGYARFERIGFRDGVTHFLAERM
jgi:hypothetical protein